MARAGERRDAGCPARRLDDLRRAVRHVAERARRRQRLHRCWFGGATTPSATSTQVARSTSRPGSPPNEPATRSCHCRSTRCPAERPSRSCVRTGNWSRPTSFATPPRKEALRRRRGSTSPTRPVLPALRRSSAPCRPEAARPSSAASTAGRRRRTSRSSPARRASTACSAARRRRSVRLPASRSMRTATSASGSGTSRT